MLEFSDSKQLRAWLNDAPRGWGALLASRVALRTVPFLFGDESINRANPERLLVAILRGDLFAWAVHTSPDAEMILAAGTMSTLMGDCDTVGELNRTGLPSAVIAAQAAHYATFAAVLFRGDPDGLDRAAYTPEIVAASFPAIWQSVSADANWLVKHGGPVAKGGLAGQPLWLSTPPEDWLPRWAAAAARMMKADPGYAVWIDWFERRIRGEEAAFDIPRDKGREEDKAILRKLALATDGETWDRGAQNVNATLQQWLDEARERAAANLRDAEPALRLEAERPLLPPQSANALQFQRGETGRIVLAERGADGLRTDADARDRHWSAVEQARTLLKQCERSNSAEQLTTLLTHYLEVAGDEVEDMRPSLFVQRGERLRQELVAFDRPNTSLPPLPDGLMLDLQSVCKAHNMLVGLDPALEVRDTALLGPDVRPAAIPPANIKHFVHDANQAGILEEEATDAVGEAASLAPASPDPQDRRTRWSTESAKNLIIETFALALNRPVAATAVVGTIAIVGIMPTMAAAGAAFGATKVLVEHREWIEAHLGHQSPTWQALFTEVCEWLERNTPFRPD